MHWQVVLRVIFAVALILIPTSCVWLVNAFGNQAANKKIIRPEADLE